MPMYEVRNRVYLSDDNKPVDAKDATHSIPPGRISMDEAEMYGLPQAETRDEQIAATENLSAPPEHKDAPGLTTDDLEPAKATKAKPAKKA